MTRIYKVPFATTGDTEELASTSQPDGKVSLPDGWTSVYELESDNPSYKPVGRKEMNGILNEVTAAISELQLQGGIVTWQAIDGGFNKGAIVYGADKQTMWQSTEDANTTDPDSGSASGWVKVIDIATAADIQNGTAGKLVDAAGLKKIDTGRIPGEVSYFAFQTPPTGWLWANGVAVSRATYSRLFSAIGTTFGSGDGSTTFNLPDLRGEFIRAWDAGRGVDAGRTLGSGQGDAIRNIQGSTTNVSSFNSATIANSGALHGALDSNYAGHTGSNSAAYHRNILFDASLVVPTANENRPRNIALAAFIFAGA